MLKPANEKNDISEVKAEENFIPPAEADEEVKKETKKKKRIPIITPLAELIANNALFLVFVITLVADAIILRGFTVKFGDTGKFDLMLTVVKPMLADIFAVIFFGVIGFLFRKPKTRFGYYMFWTVVFSILTMGNSIYYTNYKSFLSVSLLSTASQLGGVMDAVTKNILEAKDFILLFPIPVMIVTYILMKKVKGKEYVRTKQSRKALAGYAGSAAVVGLVCAGCFATMLTSKDCSRLVKMWNRESVMSNFGMYVYQISDTVASVHNKVKLAFGFDESKKKFDEFFDSTSDNSSKNEVVKVKKKTDKKKKANEYSDIFKGKNVIVIHDESMQQFTLDTYFNGEELTPNVNKLKREGLYFSNFYAQESVGTSSDSEFTFASSLMPASSGTVAINYWDRDYATTQKKFKEQGYYVFSMHGNNGSFWNRLNLHKSLGYDRLYNYTTDFDIDETIGLGLSDKSFFRQVVPKLKEIKEQNKNFYGTLIMLSNHTPFTDIERVSDYDVKFRYKQYNEETGMYEEITRNYLDGKKLGSYFKSVHYADEAIGQLMSDLENEGLLDDTVIVIYGDHDAKIKESEYNYYYNYDPFTNKTLKEGDPGYIPIDEYYYNINRKVPFIIWSKDGGYTPQEITKVMGMYDVQPTLGNMFGWKNQYALGHDIFSIPEDEENIVIFPNGNFITDKVYYDAQKDTYFDLKDYVNVAKTAPCNQVYKDDPIPLYDEVKDGAYRSEETEYSQENCDARKNNGCVDTEYIQSRAQYASDRIDVSNSIIYYDIINKVNEGFSNVPGDTNDSEADEPFAPPIGENEDLRHLQLAS